MQPKQGAIFHLRGGGAMKAKLAHNLDSYMLGYPETLYLEQMLHFYTPGTKYIGGTVNVLKFRTL